MTKEVKWRRKQSFRSLQAGCLQRSVSHQFNSVARQTNSAFFRVTCLVTVLCTQRFSVALHCKPISCTEGYLTDAAPQTHRVEEERTDTVNELSWPARPFAHRTDPPVKSDTDKRKTQRETMKNLLKSLPSSLLFCLKNKSREVHAAGGSTCLHLRSSRLKKNTNLYGMLFSTVYRTPFGLNSVYRCGQNRNVSSEHPRRLAAPCKAIGFTSKALIAKFGRSADNGQ